MHTQPTVLFEKLNLDLNLTARNGLWGQLFTRPVRVCKKDSAEEALLRDLIYCPSQVPRPTCWWTFIKSGGEPVYYCPQQQLVFLSSFALCRCRTSLCAFNLCCLSLLLWRRETLFIALNLKGLYCEANDPIAKPKCKSNQKMPIASFASLPWPCAIKDITQELWKVHWWEEESTTKRKSPKTKELRRWAYNFS